MRKLFHEFPREYKDIPLMFSAISLKLVIHAENEHNLSGKVCFTDDKMSPKSDIYFRIIRRKSGCSRIGIHLAKNSIYFIIGEHAEITIDDSIKLSLGVESETEFISNIFSL